jgi:hypothetical protein
MDHETSHKNTCQQNGGASCSGAFRLNPETWRDKAVLVSLGVPG